ncbi:MAG: M15 family metallopeptidase [Epsilonproteobacteria bacterium]|nr:M15 family metallopeptidase [Campylobacterota bacterium]
MKKITLLTPLFLLTPLLADFEGHIHNIAPKLKEKMIQNNSWQEGCPVHTRDLRYLRLTYIDFDNIDQVGELIVHKDIAQETLEIMSKLYEIGYPIYQMRLISEYKGNDWQSIEADNTSAFNCRKATGSKKWSKHAYGKAIDINPIENPYISRKGKISHKASLKYRKRVHKEDSMADRAVLLKNDEATKIFKSYGFSWGGDWRYTKDYQHFAK